MLSVKDGTICHWNHLVGKMSMERVRTWANWILRENRIKDSLLPKWGKITIKDVLELTKDHFEATDAYYYPPHEFPGIGM